MLPSSLAISASCVLLFGLERVSMKGGFSETENKPKAPFFWGGGQVFSQSARREAGDRVEGGVAVQSCCFKNGAWEW